MRSRKQRPASRVPEVNLVPMMDVLMTVLTFFIIISMSLTGQQLLNVNLPRSGEDGSGVDTEEVETAGEEAPETLVVGLDNQGNILLDNEAVTVSVLGQAVQQFVLANAEGKIILKADRDLPYEQVAELLTDLRDIGGNRVSLAFE
ncbi:MAG: biopolymer transporter ExbD [Cyanobacteria bacterium P01_H01_bin.119]